MFELSILNSENKNSIETFINSCFKYDDIDNETTISLFKTFEEYKDITVLYPVVYAHLKLAVAIAKKIKRNTYTISLYDLVQSACIGLLNAVKSYNYTLNVPFSAYAQFYIKGEVFNYLKDNFAFFKFTTKGEFKVFFNFSLINKRLSNNNKNQLTEKDYLELTEQLNVTKQDIDLVIGKFNSLYSNYYLNDGEEVNILDNVEAHYLSNPVDIIEYEEYENSIDIIQKSITNLSDREQDIINGRYITDKKLPFKHYAEKYNISIERVRQIENDAITKLRKMVVKDEQ